MVNANEAPIALDIVSEMLVERRAKLDRDVFDEIEDLAAGLGLDDAVAERLRPSSETTERRGPRPLSEGRL